MDDDEIALPLTIVGMVTRAACRQIRWHLLQGRTLRWGARTLAAEEEQDDGR